MEIHPEARRPIVNGQLRHFVRFGGDLTQGVINTSIDGVPIRVYSLAKTITGCPKYRKRLRPDLAQRALEASTFRKDLSCRELVLEANCSRPLPVATSS
jgi:hypothetical protein